MNITRWDQSTKVTLMGACKISSILRLETIEASSSTNTVLKNQLPCCVGRVAVILIKNYQSFVPEYRVS